MMLSPFSILLTFIVFSGGASAENVMRFQFNNGIEVEGLSCTDADMNKINPIFDNINPNRRNLRQINIISKDRPMDFEMDIIGQHNIKDRELATAAECKNLCKGQTKGYYCRGTPGCDWYIVRRNLAGNMTERELQSTWCTSTANSINNQLNTLVSKKLVSLNCQKLLNAPRKTLCVNDIIYGIVEHFNAWNAATDVMIQKDARDGYTVCKSTRITFQAVTNPCVKFVLTELRGPNGYYKSNYEGTAPYTIFGNDGGDMYGQLLALGTYRITAIPDGDESKTKLLTFTVANC